MALFGAIYRGFLMFILDTGNIEFLPSNYFHTDCIEVKVEGFFPISLDDGDDKFMKAIEFLQISWLFLYNQHKDDFKFFQPQLFIKPSDKIFGLRVPMMTNERWETINEKNNQG